MAAEYPITVTPKQYTGKDRKKLAVYRSKLDAASTLDKYINAQMENEYMRVFTYGELAIDLEITEEVVSELLFRVDGGNKGITVVNQKNAPEKPADS